MPAKRKAKAPPETSAVNTGDGRAVRKKAKVATDASEWDVVGDGDPPLLLYRLAPEHCGVSNKVASFDIDDTLTAVKSGAKFAKGPTDWKWLYDKVPARLREVHGEGFRIVLFTNQAGIEKKHATVDSIIGRINAMISDLGIPVSAFVSTGENHFRKPSPEMWKFFVDKCGFGDDQLNNSVYVGDAAGRTKDWKPGVKKDFSCSDRKFAANAGLAFKTPDEYFLGEAATKKFDWGFDPKKVSAPSGPVKDLGIKSEQEMVILVGPPGSGKSHLSKTQFVPKGYVHVNRDTLRTPAKCLKAAKEALEGGKSVIVDNTNGAKANRMEYLGLAKTNTVHVLRFAVGLGCVNHGSPRDGHQTAIDDHDGSLHCRIKQENRFHLVHFTCAVLVRLCTRPLRWDLRST